MCFLYYVILEEFGGFQVIQDSGRKKVLSLQMAGANDGRVEMRACSVLLTIHFPFWPATFYEIIKCLCHLNNRTFVMKPSNSDL